MGLSFVRLFVTIKKANRVYLYLLLAILFAGLARQSLAQQLSKAIELDGQKLNVQLEPLDPSCSTSKPVVLNRLICLRVRITGANDLWLKGLKLPRFDALMPGHHHGMITKPKVSSKKPGEYLIEGVKLHMSGDWSLELKLEHLKSMAQVAIPLKL